MTDTQPFLDEARVLLVKASVGTGRDVELLTQALHAAYQRGREEAKALLERAKTDLEWWQEEHGCCAGKSDALIDEIATASSERDKG